MAEEKTLDYQSEVNLLVKKAGKALDEFLALNQEQVDYIVAKCSVAGLDHHGDLAKKAIDETKRGIFEDKATKNLFACEYVVNNLQQLTRFSKATITELNIKEIREPNVKKEEIRIVLASLRLDAIVAELAKCSRNVANEIIENQRVFINYENESRRSKLLSEGDVIVIRGKGKFIVKLINGETRKGKLSVTIEHYI